MKQLSLPIDLGIPETIFINKKVWQTFSPEEMEQYIERVFRHYRECGFPYYPTDPEWRDGEFKKLTQYKKSTVTNGNVLLQTMHGLALAWSYFPHSFAVQCNDFRSPLETFLDDNLLRATIKRRLKLGDNMSDAGMRKMLRMFTGTQGVSNFRPTAARSLYRHFLPRGGTVLDMSMGYGGRMLGAICARVDYIGYDPDTRTFKGNGQLAHDYADSRISTQLHNTGSENIDLPSHYIDFAFTSPPYFDTEKYSSEPTQSYIKFPTPRQWMDGFIKATFSNVFHALKPNTYMAINIAPTAKMPDMIEQITDTGESVGFVLTDTWKYTLSRFKVGSHKFSKSKYKYEPILIFRKGK